MRIIGALAILLIMLAACGDDGKDAGATCTSDDVCESGACLTIQCTNGTTIPGACAGADCTLTGKCLGVMQCLPISGMNKSYCLPPSLCGSSTKKAAGEPCTPTTVGAAECQSNVCLQDIQCTGGKLIPGACAGADCSMTLTCSGTDECVEITGTAMAFCLPLSLCQ